MNHIILYIYPILIFYDLRIWIDCRLHYYELYEAITSPSARLYASAAPSRSSKPRYCCFFSKLPTSDRTA